MTDAGPALMGIGRGFGKTRARDAALAAISSPLLEFPIERAKGVVFTITGNSDMSLQEVNEVASVISNICAEDANIIFGTSVDETYGDEISVTVVATSFDVPPEAVVTTSRSKADPYVPPAYAPPPSRYTQPPPPAKPQPRGRFFGRF